jgi:ERF superfamily
MSDLRARAATAPSAVAAGPTPERPDLELAPLADISYDGNAITDAEAVPVQVAWARVMADVQSISKGDRRDDPGGRYTFRGVDRVINAVGPAVRRHGVLVLPTKIMSKEYGETRTAKGAVMQECKVTVQWTVLGPKGDQLPPLESAGEATDTQDKSTAKAISVAHRVLFLTALQIPTQDPDVDRGHERGERPMPMPTDYRDEIIHADTSLGRLRQIRTELVQHRLAERIVVDEHGDDVTLVALVDRIGTERRSTKGPSE